MESVIFENSCKKMLKIKKILDIGHQRQPGAGQELHHGAHVPLRLAGELRRRQRAVHAQDGLRHRRRPSSAAASATCTFSMAGARFCAAPPATSLPTTHSLFGRPYRIVDYLLLAGLV